jgi:amidohydrolase
MSAVEGDQEKSSGKDCRTIESYSAFGKPGAGSAVSALSRSAALPAYSESACLLKLDLTLRRLSNEVREQLITEVEQALSIARALGGDYEIQVQHGYPALYNDPTVAGWIRDTAGQLIGSENIVPRDMIMAGEDFAYMAQASRGAMLNLGVRVPGGPDKYVHHPEFDIDEECLPIGAAILAQTALRFVRGELVG